MVKPSRRREMAQRAVLERGMSIRAACLAFQISQACYRYEAKHQAENDEIADWLLRLTVTGALGCASCTCATSEALPGTTSACTASTGNWS